MDKTLITLGKGFGAGAATMCAIVGFSLWYQVDTCAKKHDRYTCELKIQPVGGEILQAPEAVKGE